MKVYVLLDLDAEKKDCIEGIYADKDHAIKSKNILNDMRVGGATTKIQIHDVRYGKSKAEQFNEWLEKRRSLLETQKNDPEVLNQNAIDYKIQILVELIKVYKDIHE